MTAPAPMRPTLHPRTAEILRRAYRFEPAPDVLHRALLMLARADGHLDHAGRLTAGPQTGRWT